jgi:hypothetical protein
MLEMPLVYESVHFGKNPKKNKCMGIFKPSNVVGMW